MKKFNLKREKRKLWLRQHKWQIIKYCSVAICSVILTIAVMYFSKANFSTRVTFDVIDARVAPFSSGDVVLTYNIDGEDSNTLENDGTRYNLVNYTCDNSEVVTWDNYTWSVNVSNISGKVKCKLYFETISTLANQVSLGDYVRMTPSYSGSYTTTTTGSSGSITPSELNLWRVIAKNDDGTVDVISEYTSSTAITFTGEDGYKYFVTALQTLASKYENSAYTTGSRMMGYNGQTGTISGSLTISNAGTTSTSALSGVEQEYNNGYAGDTLYAKDYNAVNSTLGTLVATNLSGTAMSYWIASRGYSFSDSNNYYWYGRYIYISGAMWSGHMRYRSGGNWVNASPSFAIRPILTLKSDLLAISGNGKSESTAYEFD